MNDSAGGYGARPMDLDWARGLREQSLALGRVFNFKQVGGSAKGKGGHLLDGWGLGSAFRNAEDAFSREVPDLGLVAQVASCALRGA